MKCPACGNALTEKTVDVITVDVCQGGCGGIWFDNFELEKVEERHEAAGESLLGIERDDAITVDHTARKPCPRCEGQVMMRHFFSVKRKVEVDECPACAGMWLDEGELASIRDQYPTEAERKRATEDYFNDVFGHELAQMQAESEEKREKAGRIARMFRFICPSYYIPGKQSWGAF